MIILPLTGERHHRQWLDGRVTIDHAVPFGRLVIIPAGCAPRAVVTDPIKVLHVYVPTQVLETLHEERCGARGPIELINPNLADAPLFGGPMSMLAQALASGKKLDRQWLDGIGTAICARAIERWSNRALVPVTQSGSPALRVEWRVRRAMDDLETRLCEDVGLAEVVAVVDLSPCHIAVAVGYSDPSCLARILRANRSLSPSDFRQASKG
jgi:AraC family transcriptional regulator